LLKNSKPKLLISLQLKRPGGHRLISLRSAPNHPVLIPARAFFDSTAELPTRPRRLPPRQPKEPRTRPRPDGFQPPPSEPRASRKRQHRHRAAPTLRPCPGHRAALRLRRSVPLQDHGRGRRHRQFLHDVRLLIFAPSRLASTPRMDAPPGKKETPPREHSVLASRAPDLHSLGDLFPSPTRFGSPLLILCGISLHPRSSPAPGHRRRLHVTHASSLRHSGPRTGIPPRPPPVPHVPRFGPLPWRPALQPVCRDSSVAVVPRPALRSPDLHCHYLRHPMACAQGQGLRCC
jgi:hypothetical protein